MYLRGVRLSLQFSILQVCFLVLGTIAVCCLFTSHGTYNYKYIPRSQVEVNLYKARNPDFRMHRWKLSGAQNKLRTLDYQNNPECDYDFINSHESTDPVDAIKDIADFTMEGISNGSYSPQNCNPAFSSAILVTYRNRELQLQKFIPYIHNFLRKQDIHYKIFVIEQHDEKPWNKGVLYNIGAEVAIAEKFRCLILHDVDMLPLDEANIYTCTYNPRHMSASVDKFRYVLPYKELVGGVAAIQSKHYERVNGFSNKFQGWGGEDDDFERRISEQNLSVVRFPPQMSRYVMMRHSQEKQNMDRHQILKENLGHSMEEGLNTVKYESLVVHNLPLYTLIRVKL